MRERREHQWQHEEWLTQDWVRCPKCGTVKQEKTVDTSFCPGPTALLPSAMLED